MGTTIVHTSEEEPVLLQGALVLVWDALEQPRSEEEICEVLAAMTDETGLERHVADALAALAAVGLVSGSA